MASALAAGIEFEAIYVDEAHASRDTSGELYELAARHGVRVFSLAPGVLERVADAATPQPVLAAVRLPVTDVDAIACEGLIVALHDVRDPGNAGTLIRSADAAGATAVIFTGHSVDPFNPKTVRASAGSLFHVPFGVQSDPARLAAELATAGYRTLGTVVTGGPDYAALDWAVPTAVFLGNESAGLAGDLVAALGGTLAIPMEGQAESLNVGVAAAVLCFEALRQRRAAAGAGSGPGSAASTISPTP